MVKRAKQILEAERDASPKELQAWARAHEEQLARDLTEAESSLAKGQGKRWDLVEFLSAAQQPRKKKSRGKKR